MKYRSIVVASLLTLVPLGVHASTKVTDDDEVVTEKLPKPAHIWVYDFAATAPDVPAESALAGQHSDPSTPPTAKPPSAPTANQRPLLARESLSSSLPALRSASS